MSPNMVACRTVSVSSSCEILSERIKPADPVATRPGLARGFPPSIPLGKDVIVWLVSWCRTQANAEAA